MQIFAHAGIGWGLAEAGRGSRRFRQAVFLSAVLPDLDGLSVLFGLSAFSEYHDRLTHSLAFSLVLSALAAAACPRERLKAVAFTQLGFYSHYFGDYYLSGWPLAYWFPFNATEYASSHALWLWHPVNYLLSLASVCLIAFLGWRLHRTPFEVVSAPLDARICNLVFRAKDRTCAYCAARTNEICGACGQPVCHRHAPLNWAFTPRCVKCTPRPRGVSQERDGR
jgi:hypothetical protein